MKRILSSLFTLLLCMLLNAQGATYESGKYLYKINNNGAVLVSPAEDGIKDVRIPSSVKINGQKYPVVAVADGAFYNQTNLLSVSIGVNVKSIGDGAFFGCPHLRAVYCYTLEPPKCSGKMAVFGSENGENGVVLPPDLTVYVSAGSVEIYRGANVWNELLVQPMVTR